MLLESAVEYRDCLMEKNISFACDFSYWESTESRGCGECEAKLRALGRTQIHLTMMATAPIFVTILLVGCS